jgi:hypothetical protein
MKSQIYNRIVGLAVLMLFSIAPGNVILVRAQTATPNIAAQLDSRAQPRTGVAALRRPTMSCAAGDLRNGYLQISAIRR